MKIIACIKYSLDVSEIKVNKDTAELSLAGVPKAVGNIDEHVLEAAVALKEAYGGSVHGLTYGPSQAKEAFREALAMGLEDVTLVVSPEDESFNPSVTAYVLAEAINKIGDVDLVICGEVSDDGFTYQVPPRLAERLDLPQVSYARTIALDEERLIVERDLGEGAQKISSPLPALISVTEETNIPRRPTLMEAMQAKKKPVHIWDLKDDLGVDDEVLEEKKHLEWLGTEGVVVLRKQIKLENMESRELAEKLLEMLIQDQVLEEKQS